MWPSGDKGDQPRDQSDRQPEEPRCQHIEAIRWRHLRLKRLPLEQDRPLIDQEAGGTQVADLTCGEGLCVDRPFHHWVAQVEGALCLIHVARQNCDERQDRNPPGSGVSTVEERHEVVYTSETTAVMIFDHHLGEVGRHCLKMDVPRRGLSMSDQLCQGQDRQRLTGVPGFTQLHRRTPSEYETQGDEADEEEDALKLGGGLLHVLEFKTDKLLLSQPNTTHTP